MSEHFSSPEKRKEQQVGKIKEEIKRLNLDRDKITEKELKQKLDELREYVRNLTENNIDLSQTTHPIYTFSFDVGKVHKEGDTKDKGKVVFSFQSDGENLDLFPAAGQFEYESELLEES